MPPVADLELDGEEELGWFAVPGAEYGSCRTCGSSLFWRSDETPAVRCRRPAGPRA